MPASEKFTICFSTINSRPKAVNLARELVKRNLAACVNILPIGKSIYRWKGKIQEDREWLLIIKTRRRLFKKLELVLHQLHVYEVPELIGVDLDHVSAPYQRWLKQVI